MDYQHIHIEQHGDQSLIKLVRNSETVAGISANGTVWTQRNAIGDLTDEELLELLSIPNGVDPQGVTYDEYKERVEKLADYQREAARILSLDYQVGSPLRLTETFWQHNPKFNRNVNITKVYVNAIYSPDTVEIAIEHDGRKFTCWVPDELAQEMRDAWSRGI